MFILCICVRLSIASFWSFEWIWTQGLLTERRVLTTATLNNVGINLVTFLFVCLFWYTYPFHWNIKRQMDWLYSITGHNMHGSFCSVKWQLVNEKKTPKNLQLKFWINSFTKLIKTIFLLHWSLHFYGTHMATKTHQYRGTATQKPCAST